MWSLVSVTLVSVVAVVWVAAFIVDNRCGVAPPHWKPAPKRCRHHWLLLFGRIPYSAGFCVGHSWGGRVARGESQGQVDAVHGYLAG